MTRPSRLKGALAACWKAALFSGGPFLILTIPVGAMIASDCAMNLDACGVGAALMASPLWIAFSVILAGFVLIGLPVSLWLERHRRAAPFTLGWIGGIVGTLLILALALSPEGSVFLLLLPSAIAGGAIAGHQWGEVLAGDQAEATAVES